MYYLLYTESDILTFAYLVANTSTDLNAKLMADITVSADSVFAGIGTADAPYAGTFDGGGCTVTLSMSTDSAAGLFAFVSGATIGDVTTAGTVESGVNTYGCAGLVSYVMSNGVTIKDCVNKADVSGAGYVAGFVGRCSASSVSVSVTDSSNEGSITSGDDYVGGIAAYIYTGSISGCINYGAVSGMGYYAGGITGYASNYGTLEISDCGNEGAVTGSSYYTGGIAGSASYGSSSATLTLDGLYNAGTVSGSTGVGGIIGRNYASLSNAYNAGTVSGTAASTGGLVGYNYKSGTVLSNAYNAGEVTYTSSDVTCAGGLLVGSITSSSYLMYVDNAYYLSTLDGSAVASGSSYLYSYSTQAALTDDELAAMAKTSDELSALADTLGDSFVANTDSDYHLGYPVLAWEVTGDDTEELQIITQPEDYTGTAGSTAVFEVEATGSELTYQWQYLNAGASTWKDSGMDGADTATVSVPITDARDGQQYRCVITDEDGSMVVSDAVTLSVE